MATGPSPHAAPADIVPSAPLVPPAAEERRRLGRGASARLLDGYLRRLARQEARGRRVLLEWKPEHAIETKPEREERHESS